MPCILRAAFVEWGARVRACMKALLDWTHCSQGKDLRLPQQIREGTRSTAARGMLEATRRGHSQACVRRLNLLVAKGRKVSSPNACSTSI